MEEAAHKVYRLLEEEAGDSLLAIGFFEQDETEVLYVSPFIEDRYSPEEMEEVLESAFFESFGGAKKEELHASELHAVTSTYDDMLNTVIPLSDAQGIAFALDREGEYRYRRLVRLVEESIDDYKLGLESSAE